MKNDIELTQEEVNELIGLYNSQLDEIKTLKIKADMYEEWALLYKRELEELKTLVREYETEFNRLTAQVKAMNELALLEKVEDEEEFEED
jgi:hypothetical protein